MSQRVIGIVIRLMLRLDGHEFFIVNDSGNISVEFTPELFDALGEKGYRRLNDWLKNEMDWEEIDEMYRQSVQQENQERKTPKSKREPFTPQKRSGYIYLLMGKHGYYKIGMTDNLSSRVKSIGIMMPFPIELVHSFKTSDMVKSENDLHERYSQRRVEGEWFILTDSDVDEIKSIKSMDL